MQLGCHLYRTTLTMENPRITKRQIISGNYCKKCLTISYEKAVVTPGMAGLRKLHFLVLLYVINEAKLKHKSCIVYKSSYLTPMDYMELCLDNHSYRVGKGSTLKLIDDWNTNNNNGDTLDTNYYMLLVHNKKYKSEDVFVSGEKFLEALAIFCATSAGFEVDKFKDCCQIYVPTIT